MIIRGNDLSIKIGRNEPCPCGSGRKYKKCCLGKDKINDLLHPSDLLESASDWILKQPELEFEFDKIMKEHVKDKMVTDLEISTIMDAFIFDHRLSNGNTPLRYFMENAKLSSNEYSFYKSLEKNIFGVFEILEVYIDKGIMLYDLVWNEKYFVKEKKGTYQIEPGQIIFCRIAFFKSDFVILTPAPQLWGKEAGYSIKRNIRYSRSDLKKKGLNAFDILTLASKPEADPDSLEELKYALKKKLRSLGINIDFRGLDRRINENKSINKAFPEIYEFNFPSNDDFSDTMDLIQQLWNNYPRKEFEGKSPKEVDLMGPKEKSLILDLFDETRRKIDPNKYSSKKAREAAVNKFRDKWLKKPQKELGGRTPMEVILEERKERGNPSKDFTVQVEVSTQKDYDENKAERLYQEGISAFNSGALAKAGELFQEVIEMYPENYKAWCNLGGCYAYLGNKKEAIKCLKKALSLEPDYEFAKNNLEAIKSKTEEQLGLMGILGVTRAFMHDIDKNNKDKEIDVWNEIDKELKNAHARHKK